MRIFKDLPQNMFPPEDRPEFHPTDICGTVLIFMEETCFIIVYIDRHKDN